MARGWYENTSHLDGAVSWQKRCLHRFGHTLYISPIPALSSLEANHLDGPVLAAWLRWWNYPVCVPEILPKLVLFPEEHLSLDQATIAIQLFDRLHVQRR